MSLERSEMAKLSVRICGIEFSNPILPAAGPPSKDGAILQAAAKGAPEDWSPRHLSETGGGAAALHGGDPGRISEYGTLVRATQRAMDRDGIQVGQVRRTSGDRGLGYTADQIRELAPLVKPYADALELSTHYVGNDISPIINALRAAKDAVDVPVFMKLSPHPNIQQIAVALEDAGADGLVMINSFGPA